MYVFPGIGLGAILSKATTVTQSMIYASAVHLSRALNEQELEKGWLYPDIARVREASVEVALGVLRAAEDAGVAREVRTREMGDHAVREWIKERMYDPHRESERLAAEVKELVEGLKESKL